MESKSSADSLLSYTHATRQDGVKFSACLPLDICKKKNKKKKETSIIELNSYPDIWKPQVIFV